MLTHKHIDVPYVIRMAGSRSYKWMTSLEPVRQDLQRFERTKSSHSKRSCCGKKPAKTSPVNSDTINQLARNPQFRAELTKLKKILAVDQLIVSVGALHTRL